jgi:ADP-heptose:LPS heptosyltransferase
LGLRPYRARMHIAGRYHEAVERLVGHPLVRAPMVMYISDARRDQARERLRVAGVTDGQTLVGVAPGAAWPTKAWPPDRFAEIVRRLDKQGARVLLFGGGEDVEIARIIRAANSSVIDLVGVSSIAELPALIESCAAFVSNDSGPMHISRALGVPTLAIFSCTDPAQFDFTGHVFVFEPPDCAPCHFYGRHRCPRQHLACLMNVTVEKTWMALQPLLDGQKRLAVLG